ncbi:PBSX family phage terminase large subunit [Arthrobacter russicus]|uniref:PBSX family phage terminase large subunit n=2 Tax=Bacillati TaxID=1783272 RepID=A0ABU1J912_9MICC|nr:PBSX family phage terminase large subunit [Arthrobacter russicus]MDR6268908.1 PBSX family phage terminase large subunit [Arthrobacter russicus]
MNDAISPKQSAFIKGSSARVNVCEGSIRSGKTIITLLRWLIYVNRAPRGGELVMIGRTRDAVWRNCVGPMQNPALFGSAASQVVGNYGAPTVKILGRVVHVLGASDTKAEKVIRGMTVAGSYVDELTVIPEEFFTQLLGRMSVPKAKLFGTTNPDNPGHWLKTKFLDRINDLVDWTAWHFTLDDNPALTEEYKASIRNEFTGLWYRRFILGEWCVAEGAVYDMWEPSKHVVAWQDLPPMRRLISVGIDYGTQHPTVAVLLGLGYDRRLYLIDELRLDPALSQVRLNDAKQSAEIRAWLAKDHLPEPSGLKPEWIIADQAGASLRTQLADDGIITQGADKAVSYGLSTIAWLLGEGQLFISDRCPGVIKEIPGYSWDPKAAEKGDDKPIKTNDDSLDAMRYAIITTESQWRSELLTNQPIAA